LWREWVAMEMEQKFQYRCSEEERARANDSEVLLAVVLEYDVQAS
jgi:hypothetical protein